MIKQYDSIVKRKEGERSKLNFEFRFEEEEKRQERDSERKERRTCNNENLCANGVQGFSPIILRFH